MDLQVSIALFILQNVPALFRGARKDKQQTNLRRTVELRAHWLFRYPAAPGNEQSKYKYLEWSDCYGAISFRPQDIPVVFRFGLIIFAISLAQVQVAD